MRSHENRNRKATLRLIPRNYPNLLLVGGIVLGVIVGGLLVVFILSPVVSAGYNLMAGFWARICNAIGPV
jgi:hypothetical protein